jgi:hypothetical protein
MQSLLDLIKGVFEKIILGFAKIVGEETALEMSGFIAGSIIFLTLVFLIEAPSCYRQIMCDNPDMYDDCVSLDHSSCWDKYCK